MMNLKVMENICSEMWRSFSKKLAVFPPDTHVRMSITELNLQIILRKYQMDRLLRKISNFTVV